MKNVNSKNPPLSEKQYEIILCTKCYCDGNFPLLLTHHDFKKVELNDRLEPGKKKKSSKNKKKDKKRKHKEKQLAEEYEEDKDYEDAEGRKGDEDYEGEPDEAEGENKGEIKDQK